MRIRNGDSIFFYKWLCCINTVQKILYYAQGFYKAFFGKFLFEDDCQAWVHGPVYVNIYEKYKEFKSANIFINMDYDIEDIIADEKKKSLMQ